MGIFDSVAGALGGAQGGEGGTGKAALIGMLLQMLGNQGASGGGLGALVDKFQGSGLGDIVQSWISTGPNRSITAEQLQQVLGSDLIGQVASALGVPPQKVGSDLAETLPDVVDKMTPDGQLPAGGGLGDIGALLGRFG